MTSQIYGGIPVDDLSNADLAETRHTTTRTLGQNPYTYESVALHPGNDYCSKGPARYCVYVLESGSGSIRINDLDVSVDHYVLGDAESLTIQTRAGAARVLVAFQSIEAVRMPLQVASVTAAKRVEKPWGHEIWLTGDPSTVFAFKRILLKSGNKTSLQYHRYKRETNFVIEGQAAFHYNPDPSVPPDQFNASDTASVVLSAPFVADVFPDLIHRLEAIGDLLLYEVSTPQLDDVIRLADDAGRRSGRIAAEHLKAGR